MLTHIYLPMYYVIVLSLWFALEWRTRAWNVKALICSVWPCLGTVLWSAFVSSKTQIRILIFLWLFSKLLKSAQSSDNVWVWLCACEGILILVPCCHKRLCLTWFIRSLPTTGLSNGSQAGHVWSRPVSLSFGKVHFTPPSWDHISTSLKALVLSSVYSSPCLPRRGKQIHQN